MHLRTADSCWQARLTWKAAQEICSLSLGAKHVSRSSPDTFLLASLPVTLLIGTKQPAELLLFPLPASHGPETEECATCQHGAAKAWECLEPGAFPIDSAELFLWEYTKKCSGSSCYAGWVSEHANSPGCSWEAPFAKSH